MYFKHVIVCLLILRPFSTLRAPMSGQWFLRTAMDIKDSMTMSSWLTSIICTKSTHKPVPKPLVTQPIGTYNVVRPQSVYPLPPGGFEWNLREAIFKPILMISDWCISRLITLRCISQDLTHDKSTLIHFLACCREVISHWSSRCWPKSISPYGVTSLKWINIESI